MNPAQTRTLTDVLAFGGPRPAAREGLAAELRDRIESRTRDTLARHHESYLFLSKSQLGNVLRCEGLYQAAKNAPRTPGVLPPVAQGTLVHRALQHCYTHPANPVEHNVRTAVEACIDADAAFGKFWVDLGTAGQSDLLNTAVVTVMTFLDSWPPMGASWGPRFEFGMQAKIGSLTLSGRTDLVLGRPRADGVQSMVIVDWKTGSLYPEHEDEADFYALLATLRFGVPPFRSFVYSLASGETTDLDVDEARLFRAADTVIAAVTSIVDVMGGTRAPKLEPSAACSWCPARDTCAAYQSAAPSSVPATAQAQPPLVD